MTTGTRWDLEGDYFENCNCEFLCPCLFAPAGPFAELPTEGYCDVMLAFHVERGTYGGTSIDGLSVVLAAHADGSMGNGGWKAGLLFDERADAEQRQALSAIFGGSEGGPMAAFVPLIGEVIGAEYVPITFTKDGRRRAVEIPERVHMSVTGVPSMDPDSEVWVRSGNPVNPERLALATGEQGSTLNAFGMQWDNSGRNGHYAAISWSNG
jgi:hypothetical protein